MTATKRQFARRKKFIRKHGMTRHVREWSGLVTWIRMDYAKGIQHVFVDDAKARPFNDRLQRAVCGRFAA